MIYQILQWGECGEIFSLHKAFKINYCRGCYKVPHCLTAQPDGGTSQEAHFTAVSWRERRLHGLGDRRGLFIFNHRSADKDYALSLFSGIQRNYLIGRKLFSFTIE